jgi:hypothetical protein
MGWTQTYRPRGQPHLKFFKERFENENFKVIDATAYLNVVYLVCAAKSSHWKNFAVIVQCRYVKERYDFFYKSEEEGQGPPESRCFCPERILKQLAPVEEVYGDDSRQYACDWREACWANIKKRQTRPKLKVGDVVKFPEILKFTTGLQTDTLRVARTQPLRFQVDGDPVVFYRVRRQDLDGITVMA